MFKLSKNINKIDCIFLFVLIIIICASTYFDCSIPSRISDLMSLVMSQTTYNMNDILFSSLKLVAFVIGSIISLLLIILLSAFISIHFSQNNRTKLFNSINNLSIQQIDNFSSASLTVRMTNDIGRIENSMNMILGILFVAPIKIIGAFLTILMPQLFGIKKTGGVNIKYDDHFYILMLISASSMVLIVLLVAIFSLPLFKKRQVINDDLVVYSNEKISGIKVIRSFNSQEFHNKRFFDTNKKWYSLTLKINSAVAIIFPLVTLIFQTTAMCIYWVAAYLMNKNLNPLILAEAISFNTLCSLVLSSILQCTFALMIVPQGNISAKRILEVIKTKPLISDPDNIINPNENVKGKIQFKNVSFKYNEANANILENINFEINKGETLGIIGPVGSGKTHLINLIPRLIDAYKGEILVDDVNVKDYSLEELRKKISYISQKTYFFSDTIFNNIKNNNYDNINDINTLAQISHSYEFIQNLPNLYEEKMSEQGSNFSGGQKQRLSILRGLNKKSEILIFDDTFSALDYITDKNIRHSLKQYNNDITKIIVSQKISTIMNANKILVIENGKITASGTHKELIKTSEFYKNIVKIQLSNNYEK